MADRKLYVAEIAVTKTNLLSHHLHFWIVADSLADAEEYAQGKADAFAERNDIESAMIMQLKRKQEVWVVPETP